MIHEAIIKLYPSVKSVVGEDPPVAYDANGDVVSWDATAVAAKEKELLDAYKLSYLRYERNLKLTETDWVVTMHKELGTNIPTAWKTYRQALRDITDDATSLDDVTWPEKP
jgi:hypothetical protein